MTIFLFKPKNILLNIIPGGEHGAGEAPADDDVVKLAARGHHRRGDLAGVLGESAAEEEEEDEAGGGRDGGAQERHARQPAQRDVVRHRGPEFHLVELREIQNL